MQCGGCIYHRDLGRDPVERTAGVDLTRERFCGRDKELAAIIKCKSVCDGVRARPPWRRQF